MNLSLSPPFFLQENIPIEEVFENLRCSREGLTTEAAEERLGIFGHNKLEEKKAPNPHPSLSISDAFSSARPFSED